MLEMRTSGANKDMQTLLLDTYEPPTSDTVGGRP